MDWVVKRALIEVGTPFGVVLALVGLGWALWPRSKSGSAPQPSPPPFSGGSVGRMLTPPARSEPLSGEPTPSVQGRWASADDLYPTVLRKLSAGVYTSPQVGAQMPEVKFEKPVKFESPDRWPLLPLWHGRILTVNLHVKPGGGFDEPSAGCIVNDTLDAMRVYLSHLRLECAVVRFIPGTGNGSVGGEAILLPALKRFLDAAEIDYQHLPGKGHVDVLVRRTADGPYIPFGRAAHEELGLVFNSGFGRGTSPAAGGSQAAPG